MMEDGDGEAADTENSASGLHFSVAFEPYPINSAGLAEAKGQDGIVQESPGLGRIYLHQMFVQAEKEAANLGRCVQMVIPGGEAAYRVPACPWGGRTKPQEGLEQVGGDFGSRRSCVRRSMD